MKYGRGIYGSILRDFLKNSYSSNQAKELDGYTRDNDLSGRRVQVYSNPDTKQAIVTHRGTQGLQDILTDIKLAFFPRMYMQSTRYQHAQDIQRQAESKYGKENITTLGHSLGAKLGSDVGGNSREIITYNKPVLPYELKPQRPQETSIRTRLDPVSILGALNPSVKQISTKTLNPITAHNVDQLNSIKSEYVGKGSGEEAINMKKELTNFDLENICKRLKIALANVIAKDEWKLLTKNGNYIINLENHNQAGSHWVALVMGKSSCVYMDSFGMPPPEQIYELLEKKYKKVPYNKMEIQDMDSTYCGYFCIAFLSMFKKRGGVKTNNQMLAKLQDFQSHFSKNTNENDRLLREYLLHV